MERGGRGEEAAQPLSPHGPHTPSAPKVGRASVSGITIPKAQRTVADVSTHDGAKSPGPGEYHIEQCESVITKAAPRPSFGRSTRDDDAHVYMGPTTLPRLAAAETPGPCAYEPHKKDNMARGPTFAKRSESFKGLSISTPGPGEYDVIGAPLGNKPVSFSQATDTTSKMYMGPGFKGDGADSRTPLLGPISTLATHGAGAFGRATREVGSPTSLMTRSRSQSQEGISPFSPSWRNGSLSPSHNPPGDESPRPSLDHPHSPIKPSDGFSAGEEDPLQMSIGRSSSGNGTLSGGVSVMIKSPKGGISHGGRANVARKEVDPEEQKFIETLRKLQGDPRYSARVSLGLAADHLSPSHSYSFPKDLRFPQEQPQRVGSPSAAQQAFEAILPCSPKSRSKEWDLWEASTSLESHVEAADTRRVSQFNRSLSRSPPPAEPQAVSGVAADKILSADSAGEEKAVSGAPEAAR